MRTPPQNSAPWLRLWLWLAALGALLAVGLVFAQPSEAGSARVLGLSAARLALAGMLLALAGAAALAARARSHLLGLTQWLQVRPAWLQAGVLLAVLLFVLTLYLVLFSLKITDAFAQARLLRLLPLTAWLLWASAAALLCWPRLLSAGSWAGERSLLRPAAVAWLTMLAVLAFMLWSGLGLLPDRTGWDTPGAPVLNTQILLAWLLSVLLASVGAVVVRRSGWRPSRLDVLIALGIWLAAVLLWSAAPLRPTHFSPAPAAPNWEMYPNSDAATLDVAAQRFLTGNGFTDIMEKPLYAFLLVILHAVAGQDYATVVNAQIALLALFPVVLYFIAARLHHRLSGLLLALVVIVRELNTLALSNRILVSHSKLLMTDLPAALGLALFTLLVLHWLQHKGHSPRWALAVGAALGLLLLLRSQILIFLPFLLLLALLRASGPWRARAGLAAALLAGFVLTAVPWMMRNGVRLGEFGYSQPYQALYMARQYSLTPEDNDPGFDVETTSVDEYVSLGFANVRQFALAHPGEVARFITAHFLHNEMASLLALPARFDFTQRSVEFYSLLPYWPEREAQLWAECCSLSAYIDGTPYWAAWDGTLPPDFIWPLALNLALVALGIGAAWRKLGWLTLVPVGIHLLYSASTALARVSGWRLILPADWVLILFYCLGVGQLTLWLARYLLAMPVSADRALPPVQPARPVLTRSLAWAAVVALAAGAFIPLVEYTTSLYDRYAGMNDSVALTLLQAAADGSQLDVAAFVSQPGADLYWGRALYPRYRFAGTDEDDLPFSHMHFRLVGPQGHFVLALPAPVQAFPNGSDVVVLACQADGYLHAQALVFVNDAARPLFAAPQSTSPCQP